MKPKSELSELLPSKSMEVVKVLKTELHLSDEDRQYLLKFFDNNRKLVEVIYNVLKSYGYMEICRGMRGKRCPTKLRRLIRECVRAKGILPEWKASLMELQIDKVWESFVGTYKAHRKMPSEKIIDSLSNILRVRISKVARSGRFYRRMLTFEEEGGLITASLRVGRRDITSIIGKKEDFEVIIKGMEASDGLMLGDPAELVRYGDRVFLHLPIIKRVTIPKEHERVVGVNLGLSRYFLVAVAYDVKNNEVMGVLKVPSDELRKLWEVMELVQRRRTLAFRKVRGKIGSKYRRGIRNFKKKLLKLAKKGRISYDDLLLFPKPVRWLLPFEHNPRRALKIKESRSKTTIAPRDELGRSVWKWSTRQFVYSCVNRLIDFAKKYNCTLIVCENLKYLRYRVSRLKRESRELGKLYSKTRDFKVLREKRRIDRAVKLLARFPYGVFMEDLRSEALWNGIAVRLVSPKGAYTTCPRCGYDDRNNRMDRDSFRCGKCGYSDSVHFVASLNIALKPFAKSSI